MPVSSNLLKNLNSPAKQGNLYLSEKSEGYSVEQEKRPKAQRDRPSTEEGLSAFKGRVKGRV